MYGVMDGERIGAMRQERGLSRRGLAERAGVGVKTVARVERGERYMRKESSLPRPGIIAASAATRLA